MTDCGCNCRDAQAKAFIVAADCAQFLINDAKLTGEARFAVECLRTAYSAAAIMVEMGSDATGPE